MPSSSPPSHKTAPLHERLALWRELLNPLALFSQRPGHPDDPPPEALIGKGVRFVKRIYLLRTIGLGVGFFCVAAAFVQQPVAWPLWALLVFHGYLWPQVAHPHSFPFRLLNLRWVQRIGIYSYSIYLSHEILLSNVDWVSHNAAVNIAVAAVFSLLFAMAVDRCIDAPLRMLRARFR